MASASIDLCDRRVLVVEDNYLVADVVCEQLDAQGFTVVGPAANVAGGLELVERGALDGAVLDINLAGEYCFPIAEALTAAGVPFVFLTGYDDEYIIPKALRSVPRLKKPFRAHDLTRAAVSLFRPASTG